MAQKYQLKNRSPVSSAIRNDLRARLKAYSKETSIPMSKLLDKAVEMFLESLESEKTVE